MPVLTIPCGRTNQQGKTGVIDHAVICGFPDGGNDAETSIATSANIRGDRTLSYPGATMPGFSGAVVMSGSKDTDKRLRVVSVHTGRLE